MCSVGDSFGVELQSGATDMYEFVCNDCSKKFKGILSYALRAAIGQIRIQ